MLGDSIIYFHLDLSASVAAGRRVQPLFVTTLTRRALDWNIRVLKGWLAVVWGDKPSDFDGFPGNISQRACSPPLPSLSCGGTDRG